MIEILESKSISVKIFDLFLKSIFWHQGPNLYKHFLILASIPWITIDQVTLKTCAKERNHDFMTESQVQPH